MTRIENGAILLQPLSVLKMSARTHTHVAQHTHFSYFSWFSEKLRCRWLSCGVRVQRHRCQNNHKLRRLAQSKLTTCMLLSYGCNCCCCCCSRCCCCCGCCNTGRAGATQRVSVRDEVGLRVVLVLPLECNQRARSRCC